MVIITSDRVLFMLLIFNTWGIIDKNYLGITTQCNLESLSVATLIEKKLSEI